MSKRFTDNDKWQDDWFLALPNEYKFAWFYILDKCDHAGIFKPNFTLFSIIIGEKIDKKDLLTAMNEGKTRIRELENGRWLIEDFIVFQYGTHLNPKNRVHLSIRGVLADNGVYLRSIRGLEEVG